MKNAGIACVVVCAAMVWTGVRAEENPLLVDGVLEVNVPSGEQAGFTDEQIAALKDPACVELKKTGAGTLTLKSSAGVKTFAGKITIAEGTYMVGYQPSSGNDSPLGTGDGQTEVMSGATLGFRCYMAADVLKSEQIIVGGKGFNDGGALRRENPSGTGTCILGCDKLTLSSDTLAITTDATKERGIEIKPATLDMNGHTLRSEGMSGGLVCVDPKEVVNAGHIYLKSNGKNYNYPDRATLADGPGHTLTIDAPAYPSYGVHTNFCNWTLKFVQSGCGIRAYTPPFVWDGPVVLPDTGTFLLEADCRNNNPALDILRLNGPISGGAQLVSASGDNAYVILAGTNTFTGGLTWSAGNSRSVIVLMVPEALPDDPFGNKVTYKSYQNALALGARTATNPGGWDFASITNAWEQQFLYKSGNLQTYVAPGETFTAEADLDSSFNYYWRSSKSLRAGACGGGEFVFKGTFDGASWWKNFLGENMVISAKDGFEGERKLSYFYTDGGKITLRDMGYFTVAGMACGTLGTGQRGEVVIEGDSVMGKTGNIVVGSRDTGASGRLRINEGAIVSNGFSIAYSTANKNNNGELMLRGGDLRATSECTIGGATNSCGAVEVESGSLTITGASLFFARYTPTACGVFRQTGGSVAIRRKSDGSDRYVGIGAGKGLIAVEGGDFRVEGPAYMPQSYDKVQADAGGRADLVVSGGTAAFESGLELGDRSDSEAAVTLKGGVLEAGRIAKRTATWNGGFEISGAYASVTFDGGTLKTRADGEVFGAGDAAQDAIHVAPDAVYVREGGATIDTAGHNATVSVPLAKVPTAGGITALKILNDKGAETTLTGYHSRPAVIITGDGHGATAIADYDYDTYKVTGITITNPGWGYTAANTTAKVFLNGESAYSKALTVTIGDNAASGGLVKTGEGVLTLTAANTYEGATEIREGGLRFSGDAAVPSAGKLLLTGGYLMTENVDDFPTELHVNLGELDENRRYVIASFDGDRPATMPTVYVNDSTTYPTGYCLWYRGKDLVFGYRRGVVLLVR